MKKYLILWVVILTMSHNLFAQERISNLITPVSYFVNHLKPLSMLSDSLNIYKQASIIGISGIGKTQLVRMYAYENKNNYDLIWFFDCNLDLNMEFLKLAMALNKFARANIPEDSVTAKSEVMNYLANQSKWLLVFDNLKINQNKKVQDLINWEHNGNVIFCSQDSAILPSAIAITAFNKDDTIILANNILENQDQTSAEFLASEFNGYPILIVQGAQLLNKVQGLDKEEYKKKIHESADKIKLNISLAIKELSPTAARLLHKIALINNQNFSKQLLSVITDNPDTLSDDIYQISKFMLISNTDHDESNPVFEMHDVIAQKILEINGDRSNESCLENIIDKLTKSIPESVVKGRVFRSGKTIKENIEIIVKNEAKYNINIYKILGLKLHLIIQYVGSLDYYNAEKLIEWFNKNDSNGSFKLLLMNNDEKSKYATYLGLIGAYHRKRSENRKAIEYYLRAKEIFDSVKYYENWKCDILYQLAMSQVLLGRIEEGKRNISAMEKMYNDGVVERADKATLYFVTANLFFAQGKYNEALEQINSTMDTCIKSGMDKNDLLLTHIYLLKAELLNSIGKYNEAYAQAQQLYDMQKPVKKKNHEVFARIYTQTSKSELGIGMVAEGHKHINSAIDILLADESRNPKNVDYSEDPDLAAAYVTQGDIFFAQDRLKEAIDSYMDAQKIYFYLYKDDRKNVAHVSYLYTQGAKASCLAKDLYHYQCFGRFQVREFGAEHPNTTNMLKYCNNYNMDLWQGDN